MKEYTVRIKDYDQNTTHVVKQYANSQAEANQIAYRELQLLLNSQQLEIL